MTCGARQGAAALVARLASLVLVVLLVACTTERPAQVIVVVHAEAPLDARARSVRVRVSSEEGELVLDRTVDATGELLARVPLVPREEDVSRRFVVQVELFDADQRRLGRVEARGGYTARELRELHLWFDSACEGVDCGDGRTCQQGVCAGSCFEPAPAGAGVRATATCGECETCSTTCVAVEGLACGCAGERCSQGSCAPRVRVGHVTAGDVHTCAALDDGAVYCWGSTTFEPQIGGVGRLGTGEAGVDSPSPVFVPGARGRVGLSAGGAHTCAIANGSGDCWGLNHKGQLAGATTERRQSTPVPVPDLDLGSLSSGFRHSCGVGDDTSTLFCWGYNERGNLGLGHVEDHVGVPTRVGDGFSTVAAGGDHTCAVRLDGSLACWGLNGSGELGALVGPLSSVPVQPGCEPSNTGAACFQDFKRVGAGRFHSCGIRSNGAMYCWGGNRYGQLGGGPPTSEFNVAEPLRVRGEHVFGEVTGGQSHTCALDESGRVHCWGLNDERQLGVASSAMVFEPALVTIPGDAPVRTIALGARHTCAIRSDHTLYCWGRNVEGQVGIGRASASPVDRPHRVCF